MGIVAFLVPQFIQAQSQFKMVYQYNARKEVSYSVPSTMNLDSITAFDIATVKPYIEYSTTFKRIDQSNNYSVQETYLEPMGGSNDWPSKVYGSFMSINGTSLVDNTGSILHTAPISSENLEMFIVPNDEVNLKFKTPPVTAPSQLDMISLNTAGFVTNVYSNNGSPTYEIYNDTFKVVLIPNKQTVKQTEYKNGRIISESEIRLAELFPGSFVQIYRMDASYLPMLKGGRLRKCEETYFTNQYLGSNPPNISAKITSITSEGENSIDKSLMIFEEESLESRNLSEPKIYPIPTNSDIIVNVPGVTNEVFDAYIFDISGKQIIIATNLAYNLDHQLASSLLKTGTYLIQIKSAQGTHTKRFIKN